MIASLVKSANRCKSTEKSTVTAFASPRRCLVALLAAAALVRLYGCWALRHNLNLDAGVVALMARHIARGEGLPVFFYGQPHMGALEPWLSGLACRLFGESGFAVCLGTVLVAGLILPVVYGWARQIGGPVAGAFALLFLVIGPGGFFHYSVSPRGAYAAILLFGTAVMAYSAFMTARWRQVRRRSGRDFCLLGLLAGLAWWSGPLSAPAILTAALILAAGYGPALISWRLFVGAAGFLAGSAPFWLYNLMNDWASFGMQASMALPRLRTTLQWFFVERFPSLMIRSDWPAALRALAALVHVAVAATALLMLIRAWRAGRREGSVPALAAALLYVPVLALVFSLSHFAAIETPRYLLPLVPVFAVLFGAAVSVWRRLLPRGLYAAPVLLLLLMQLPTLRWAAQFERREAAQRDRLETLAGALEAQSIDWVYARNLYRAWNFALAEKVVFCDLIDHVYTPHVRRAELSDTVAVLNDYGGVRRFLETGGGTARVLSAAGYRVHHAFAPPAVRPLPLSRAALPDLLEPGAAPPLAALSDGRVDTHWKAANGPLQPLTLPFREPLTLAGLRLAAPRARDLPRAWRLEGWREADGWFDILPDGPMSHYFWSGPRPCWGDPFLRVEAVFEPVRVERLRLVPYGGDAASALPWRLHGLQLMMPTPDPELAHPAVDATIETVCDVLRDRGIRRLYADRWEAGRIYVLTGGTIWTPLAPAAFNRPAASPYQVELGPDTAFLVKAVEADDVVRTLAARGFAAERQALPPWVLLQAPADAPWTGEEDAAAAAGLHWAGFSLFEDKVRQAPALTAQALAWLEADPFDPRIVPMLQDALQAHPFLDEARQALVRAHTARGETDLAREQAARLRGDTRPPVEAPIRFGGTGIRFLGYRLETDRVRPGQTVPIRYYWRHADGPPATSLAVFVHLINGPFRFQDDHVYLEDFSESLERAVDGRVVTVDRELVVPSDAPPGRYRLVIGLCQRRDGRRLAPRTALDVRRRAVSLPGLLTVTTD